MTDRALSSARYLSLSQACLINPKKSELRLPSKDLLVSFVPMAAVDEQFGCIIDPETRPFDEVQKGFTYFREGDILFAKITPCMENGKAAIARGLVNGIGFGSTEFHILRPKEGVLPEWVYYFVRWNSFRAQAATRMTGSAGQQRVPVSFLEEKTIPIPSVEEQQRIIATLQEADSTRRTRVKAQERTNQLTQAIFLEMFGHPMTNVNNWPITRLKELTTIHSGGTPSKKRSEYWSGKIPWISPKDMHSFVINDTEDHITEQAIQDSATSLVPERTVLVVVRSGILKRALPVAITSRPMTFNQDIKAFKPNDRLLPEFLAVLLRILAPQLLNYVKQGTVDSLSTNVLEEMSFPLPPLENQKRFALAVKEVDALRWSQSRNLQSLNQLFESLVARAFTGELTPKPGRKHVAPNEEDRAVLRRFPRRQQVVLALLNEQLGRGRGGVTQTQMMKYTFLTQKRGGRKAGVNRLYQFQPYHFGPFDKKVYADLKTLTSKGLIQIERRSKITRPGGEFTLIRLTAEGVQIADGVTAQLDAKLRQTIKSVITEFGHLTHDQLLKRVYQLYPRYATKSVKRALLRK